jgi:hypothetical protein
MISGISQGAVDISRSLDALAALLTSSSEQTTRLAEKLLKVDVAQTIQDSTVGTQIDVSA